MHPEKETQSKYGLLGIVAFLRNYPGKVALSLTLLMVVVTCEMSLPQVLGSAITNLRWHMDWGAEFPLRVYVSLFVSIVLIRAGTAYILGPIRNRVIQGTLADIRKAIYDAMQRLSFRFHDRSSSGEL